MSEKINIKDHRKSEYDVDDIFITRWSPRAMSGENIDKDDLMSLFEAARWAPSCFNNQSWRFLYAMKNTPAWDVFFGLMVEFNQAWAKNAGALIVIASKKTFDHNGEPNSTHSFDTGAAWQSLALQGNMKGLVVHGMAGFDYEKAAKALDIPEDYQVEAMAAVGKPGQKQDLPEALQEKEIPSSRKSISEIAGEGKFNF